MLLLLLWQAAAPAQKPATQVIHGAGTVHDLSVSQGGGVHASLQAVVTYSDPAEHLLFVQDKTGGIFVNGPQHSPVTAGDLVSIEGGVKYGYRAGVAEGATIQVLGRGATVQPVAADYESLATGRFDTRLVRISGVVRDAVVEHHPESQSDPLHLDLGLESGSAEVYVKDHPGLDPFSLLGKRVLLTGVAGGAFNAKQQMIGIVLYSQDMRSLVVQAQEAQPWDTLPLTDSNAIFAAEHFREISPRLRIRGTLTYFAPGESAYLDQGGKGVFVQTRQTGNIAIGDVVDAYGFPNSRSYVPSLRAAVLRPTSERQEIAPQPLTYDQAIVGRYADLLISVQGKVLSQLRSAESSSLTLEVQGHVVRGTIQDGGNVPSFPLGSLVRITGICRISTGGPWREPVSFSVLARSGADLVLLHKPSWWNIRHLAKLLGVLLCVSLVITAWAMLLRQRVIRQAKRIQSSMRVADKRSAVLKQISLNPPLETMLVFIREAVLELLPDALCHFDLESRSPASGTRHLTCVLESEIQQEKATVGTFAVFMQGPPSPQEREVLAVTRELLMLALNNAALHRQLMHHSTHDSLTDLPNRRLCGQRLDQMLSEAASELRTFTVLYVDVNRFKSVNDRYGHKVGDLYLQAIAKRLLGELRRECTVARIGGDEFMVLLPDSDESTGWHILHRLQTCFARPFKLGSVRLKGSASFGLASYPAHGQTREELEQHADSAMYSAKSEGRRGLRPQEEAASWTDPTVYHPS